MLELRCSLAHILLRICSDLSMVCKCCNRDFALGLLNMKNKVLR